MDNDWKSLGSSIFSEIKSATGNFGGGLMGGLIGGIVGMGINRLFGGKKKSAPSGTASDPIHSRIINPEDIATAFLVASQNAMLRGAGAGLTQLENQRLSQATAGLAL